MEELERRLERPSSEARPLRRGPSPLGAGPGEVPGHSPSPYSPGVRGREIQRTSPKRSSEKFAVTKSNRTAPVQ
jgi:hypothetical protein